MESRGVSEFKGSELHQARVHNPGTHSYLVRDAVACASNPCCRPGTVVLLGLFLVTYMYAFKSPVNSDNHHRSPVLQPSDPSFQLQLRPYRPRLWWYIHTTWRALSLRSVMSSGAASTDTSSSRGAYVHKAIWVLAALATTFLGLRIYCKFRRRRGLWWDDYFLLLSWILLLVGAITTTIAAHNGFGHHHDTIGSETSKLLRILGLVSVFSSFTSAVASKTSFAVTLIRLSDGWLRRLEWAIVISLNLLLPLCAYCIFGFCTPTAKIWKPYIEGKCRSMHVAVVIGIVFGSYMAFCDIVLALLPWGILMRFRMYRREKISIAIAMSMGVFACATAVVMCTKMPLLLKVCPLSSGASPRVPYPLWLPLYLP
ncbi:hypothetical protein CMQ_2200 [Grosmannia clavigera kw1407]|uniref:Rhodopsin domain-containing protein n=1 Tax=Grosmannia clavigera (strain kw1407 / UAMH 11150) TaxID=655863 RepID=F0XJT5_GROCL|nr:uncharacterized protein CMQ_2200 [Grosmannia clavigera kw1407]EFX02151.1 hypothetical protein CMQ_2200 [Grosmannia clavigera kw1407]